MVTYFLLCAYQRSLNGKEEGQKVPGYKCRVLYSVVDSNHQNKSMCRVCKCYKGSEMAKAVAHHTCLNAASN